MKRSILQKAITWTMARISWLYRLLTDRAYLKLKYWAVFGKRLDLKNPRTFNEKIQWLKLYDRNPFYTKLVDKYEVKKIVGEIIGSKYVIPTYGVWDRFDDIEFDKLPNQFVLKCTHDSGSIVICKDKQTFDVNYAKRKINKCLKRNYYYFSREWPYKNVKPRIIAEKYMEDTETSELRDYKFFCFNGKVKVMFIATDRQAPNEDTKFDFFDTDYNHLDLRNGHPNAATLPEKPKKFQEMIRLAESLSKGIQHVRVDFYEVGDDVFFGELTFSHWAGMGAFEPEKWDRVFGDWIDMLREKT